MRRGLRNILAVTAMTIPLAGIAPLAAGAATAGPVPHPASSPADASSSGCTTGNSAGNVKTCITITGSGLHVRSIQTSATVISSARVIQSCLRGPQGTIGCFPSTTTFVNVGPGTGFLSIGFPWDPNANEPAEYCARTFRLNADGTDTLIGQVCEDVHA